MDNNKLTGGALEEDSEEAILNNIAKDWNSKQNSTSKGDIKRQQPNQMELKLKEGKNNAKKAADALTIEFLNVIQNLNVAERFEFYDIFEREAMGPLRNQIHAYLNGKCEEKRIKPVEYPVNFKNPPEPKIEKIQKSSNDKDETNMCSSQIANDKVTSKNEAEIKSLCITDKIKHEVNVKKNNDTLSLVPYNRENQVSTMNHNNKSCKKDINILVLGQTGVGKSTWINAFANYLTYETMDDAIAAEAPICLIPTKFSLTDNNNQRHEIIFGTDDNEVFARGQSATQNARTYSLEHNQYTINIIDTPGMGDCRGTEQDDINVKNILRAVAPFKELHAICFLFKANDARMTQSFKYCISRLLSNLSKSSLDNACFIFTNSRGTFYKPGDTMDSIHKYFEELKKNESLNISINDDNTFCLDNEAFRFVCAHFSGMEFSFDERKTFSDSWEHSWKAINRLLEYAERIRPHNTMDTFSINETRTWILQLVIPTIEISKIIQTNVQQLNYQVRELELIENKIEKLQHRAAIPFLTLDVKPLRQPRTVCTSDKCVKYQEISGSLQPVYTTVCHEECYLENVDPERIQDPALKTCAAFKENNIIYENCVKCGCSWKEHMRITYEQSIVEVFDTNKTLQIALASIQDASLAKQKIITTLQQKISDYRTEFNFILNAMIQFSIFYTNNGIAQQSDIFEKHLENLIASEEKVLRHVLQYDNKNYNFFAKLLITYRDMRNQYNNTNISLSSIQNIRKKLFDLPLNGAKIGEFFDIHVAADQNDHEKNIKFFKNPILFIKKHGSKILQNSKKDNQLAITSLI